MNKKEIIFNTAELNNEPKINNSDSLIWNDFCVVAIKINKNDLKIKLVINKEYYVNWLCVPVNFYSFTHIL